VLHEHKGSISLPEIGRKTAIMYDDILSTLQSHDLLKFYRGSYMVSVTPRALEKMVAAWCPWIGGRDGDNGSGKGQRQGQGKGNGRRELTISGESLNWTPDPDRVPVVGRRRNAAGTWAGA